MTYSAIALILSREDGSLCYLEMGATGPPLARLGVLWLARIKKKKRDLL